METHEMSKDDIEVSLHHDLKTKYNSGICNDWRQENEIIKLMSETKKINFHLKELERLVYNFELEFKRVENRSEHTNLERKIPKNDSGLQTNGRIIKTLIELSCECVTIRKKFKYLKKLVKNNAQPSNDSLQRAKLKGTRKVNVKEDKFCQVVIGDIEEASASSQVHSNSTNELTDHNGPSVAELMENDALMSEMFYLPSQPELPDMRLFSLI